MDILPINVTMIFIPILKFIVVIAAVGVVLINYFHSKEAMKMEKKLEVLLPGSIHLAISIQLFLSILFLFASTVVLLIF